MALASGTKLGPYEIQVPLGAGGMGEVYRARDTRLDRDVAVKILPASFSGDSERLQRFAQESRATAALNHPNILSIYDIGDEGGTPYVVSELLEGETLRDRLRGSPLSSTRKAIEYAQQIARGLAAAHEKGIVHRDLKPENLFITSDGRVKILDFGLAKFTQPENGVSADAPTVQVATEAGMVLGTAGYMSPEQVRSKPADARSDIFAFGAILYEMLSGKRAFKGDSTADTMSAILKEDPPDLSETNRNIPPGVERIVRHCLEKNPSERVQSARDVAFDLEALTDVSAATRGSIRTLPEARFRRRWVMSLAAGLLMLASWVLVYRLASGRAATNPTFHEITFRDGTIWDARFAPDGQTIIYDAAWDGGSRELYSTQLASSDSRLLGLPSSDILSISSKGEMALTLRPRDHSAFTEIGTLARVPLSGGAPRELLENVLWADWAADGQSLAVIRPGNIGFSSLEYPVGKTIYQPNGWVGHVRFSPNGEFLAVADHIVSGDDGRVVIIDQQGNRKASSSFYSSVQGIAWRPDGKEVWFTAAPAGSHRAVYAMDFSGKERLVYRAPTGLTILDVNRNGLVLLTTNKTRVTISALPPGETRERSLSWFDWSLLCDLSADGKLILFSETGQAGGGNYSIFLRKTDGSPAIRLGDGSFGSLSPDGQWVISEVGSPTKLMLLPTGAGEPRQLTNDTTEHLSPGWAPGGKSIVFSMAEPGHRLRTYSMDLDRGATRAITPENTLGNLVTPDGNFLLALESQRQPWLYPIAGGEGRKLNFTLSADERFVNFINNGKSVLVRTRSLPVKIIQVDLATGQRTPWKEIVPSEAGVRSIPRISFSADGKWYAYSLGRVLSDLYVVDGLR